MNWNSVLTGLAIVAAGVGATACGSSSSSSSSSSSGTTTTVDDTATFKRAYSAQRTALNRVSDEIGQVITTADGKSDAQLEADLRRVQGAYHAQLAKLATLKPPQALKATFTAVQASARTLDDDLVHITAAAAAHDAAAAQTATQQLVAHIPALKVQAAKLVKALGLPPSSDAAPATATTAG